MKPIPVTPADAIPRTANSTAPARAPVLWQAGEILTARVLASHDDQRLTLRIGEHRIQARSQTPFPPGTPLTLQVADDNPELLELRVLPRDVRTPQELARSGLRQSLPRQAALVDTLPRLFVHRADTGAPAAVTKSTAGLEASLLRLDGRLAGGAVRDAVLNSGAFLESRLAQLVEGRASDPRPLQQDLKVALLRLLALAQREVPGGPAGSRPVPAAPHATHAPQPPIAPGPTPAPARANAQASASAPAPAQATPPASPGEPVTSAARLVQVLESGLAGIESRQFAQLGDAERPAGQALTSLPVFVGDTLRELQLRIEREPDGGARAYNGAGAWTLSLELQTDGLGTVGARLALGPALLDVALLADSSDTLAELQGQAQTLQARLDALGAGQTRLRVLPLSTSRPATQPHAAPLVDTRA